MNIFDDNNWSENNDCLRGKIDMNSYDDLRQESSRRAFDRECRRMHNSGKYIDSPEYLDDIYEDELDWKEILDILDWRNR